LGNWLKIGVLVAICLIPLFIVPVFADPLTLFHITFVDSFSVAGQETVPTDVVFSSDGTKMFVLGAFGLGVHEYVLSTAFDVSTASFVNSFDVSAQDLVPHGLAFSSDGTKMFVVGSDGVDVNEYTLTGAFDVSTASFVDSFSVAAQDTFPTDVTFSSDGTKMFVVGASGDAVYEYTLTSGFDVSTASFVDSFSVAGQETGPSGVAFSSDGTKMFVVGNDGVDVDEYTLSTAFDVSTASFADSFSVAGRETVPQGLAFNSDGTKMFVVGSTGDDVNEYTLGTGFTLFHTTFVDSFSIAGETFPTGVAFNSDGTKMFVLGNAGDDVNEYTLTSGFDVSTASFVDSFSVAAQDTIPTDVAFSSDGTKMFVVGNIGDDVNEYTLSSPFDVSTASFVDSFSVAAQDTEPRGLAFSSDGTKMFVVGDAGDDVNEYTLSSGFDVSTATFVGSFLVVSEETNPTGVAFSSDGTKMFVLGSTGDAVYEYTLTSPFDVSTASIVTSFSVAGQETNPRGLAFSSDGTKMFVVGSAGDDVNEYTLTSPFDISNISFVDSFSVAGETVPTGLAFSSDGTKMFVVGSNGDAVSEYTLTSPFDVSTASIVTSFSVAAQETLPEGVAFNSDGTKMFVVGNIGDAVYEYTLSAFDVSTASFVGSFSVLAQDIFPTDVAFSSDGTKMFVVGSTGDDVNEYVLTTAFDVSTASFVVSFSVNAQENNPRGLAFSSDGTKMFVVGDTGDDVNEYTLTSPFDVSTASFVDSFSVAGQEVAPHDLAFSPDGTKMFVVGIVADNVNEYTLIASFNLFHNTFVDSFSVAAQETLPVGVAFSSDGTKMFVVGNAGDDVNEYTLSSPFDVSTASFVDSFSVAAQEIFPHDITFSSDGTKMFVVGIGGQDVNEYTLSTAFDVSTATFVGSFSVVSQETSPTGVVFSSDGLKMFVVGNAGDDVDEYTLTTPFDVTDVVTFVDSFSVAAQETMPQGLAFGSDGTTMFVVGDAGNDVNQYRLTTPFDVSTASFADSFSVAGQDTEPTGLAFSSDGTKMFVVGDGDAVYEYTINTELVVPTITSAVWDDPDDGDGILSAGDTLTLTFDIATNAPSVSNQAEIDPIVNVAGLFGTTALYSGAWSAGNTVLTITINSVGTASSVIGGNVGPGVTSVTNAAGTSVVWSNTISSTGDFGVVVPCIIETALNVDTIISSSCTVTSSITAGGSVIVQNGAVMTIPAFVTLDIDFTNHNLTVKSGSGVLIKAGGKIT